MKNVMEYKGYYATISYSPEDECFIGEVKGLKKASISFEGNNIKELKKDFKNAIDTHLKVCRETNTDPEKQCKGSLNVRLGTDLHMQAKIKSDELNISINELIKRAVAQYIKTC